MRASQLDPNSRKLTEQIRKDDGAARPLSVRLLREHPATFGVTREEPIGDQLRRTFALTPSQELIFGRSRRYPLQCVNGPPGSGKTYFSAALICRLLLHALGSTVRPTMRVLVTAFTHEAINNLLNKITELLSSPAAQAYAEQMNLTLPTAHKSQFDDSNSIEVGCTVHAASDRSGRS